MKTKIFIDGSEGTTGLRIHERFAGREDVELLPIDPDKRKDIEERKWYISQTIKNGWSTNVLKNQIKNKLYERQAIADKTTNFENTLPDIQSDLALQTLKDPYIFDFIALKGQVKEKEIEEAMITKIKNVLLELRYRFCFCWKSI